MPDHALSFALAVAIVVPLILVLKRAAATYAPGAQPPWWRFWP